MAMNPMKLLKLKDRYKTFKNDHPTLVKFGGVAAKGALVEGSRVDIKITTPDGKAIATDFELTADDVYLIGGASLYNSLISLCDRAIITSIRAEFEADCWFPNLDEDPDWVLEEEEPPVMSEKGVEFTVKHYKRK